MKLKYWKFIAGIVFLFILSSCGGKSKDPAPNKNEGPRNDAHSALSVEGYLVSTSVLNSSIEIAGSVNWLCTIYKRKIIDPANQAPQL